MLDITLIRAHPDLVKQAMRDRQQPELVATIDRLIELDARRRALLTELEALKAKRNASSREIGALTVKSEPEGRF